MAGAWSVNIPHDVQTQLKVLLETEGERCYEEALDRIGDLRDEPAPADAKLLQNTRDHYRIHVCKGRWRLIYRVLFRPRRVFLVSPAAPWDCLCWLERW